MKNSPYLDRPFVPLAVALRSHAGGDEAKVAAAEPAKKTRLSKRVGVLREWLAPKSAVPLSTS